MRTALLVVCLFLFVHRACSLVDTDGDPVMNKGGAYYLVPVSKYVSGGLGLAAVGNNSIPNSVVLDRSLPNGLPVRFGHPLHILWISDGMPVGIRFVNDESVIDPWKVEEEFPIGWTVKVSPDLTTFVGPFAVLPVETGYKIVYNPVGTEMVADLGIVYQGGRNLLAVKDGHPFIFKIKKAFPKALLK